MFPSHHEATRKKELSQMKQLHQRMKVVHNKIVQEELRKNTKKTERKIRIKRVSRMQTTKKEDIGDTKMKKMLRKRIRNHNEEYLCRCFSLLAQNKFQRWAFASHDLHSASATQKQTTHKQSLFAFFFWKTNLKCGRNFHWNWVVRVLQHDTT